MFNMNSGYSGYSMSNRAVEAYDNGEKPLSKWTKADMLEVIEAYISGKDMAFNMTSLKKAPKVVIAELVLIKSSWHHTSSYCNATEFYAINLDILDQLTDEKIKKAVEAHRKSLAEAPSVNRYKGTIQYLEWSGTRNHPKATKCELSDVNIEEKGCFYIVTDDSGNILLKKKIGSNGTSVTKCVR